MRGKFQWFLVLWSGLGILGCLFVHINVLLNGQMSAGLLAEAFNYLFVGALLLGALSIYPMFLVCEEKSFAISRWLKVLMLGFVGYVSVCWAMQMNWLVGESAQGRGVTWCFVMQVYVMVFAYMASFRPQANALTSSGQSAVA